MAATSLSALDRILASAHAIVEQRSQAKDDSANTEEADPQELFDAQMLAKASNTADVVEVLTNTTSVNTLERFIGDKHVSVQVAIWKNPHATDAQRHVIFERMRQAGRIRPSFGEGVYTVAISKNWDVTGLENFILAEAQGSAELRKAIAEHKPALLDIVGDWLEQIADTYERLGLTEDETLELGRDGRSYHLGHAIASEATTIAELSNALSVVLSFSDVLDDVRTAKAIDLASIIRPGYEHTYPGMPVDRVAALVKYLALTLGAYLDRGFHIAMRIATEARAIDEDTEEMSDELCSLLEPYDLPLINLLLLAHGRRTRSSVTVPFPTFAWFREHHQPAMFERLWAHHADFRGDLTPQNIGLLAELARLYDLDVSEIAKEVLAEAAVASRFFTDYYMSPALVGRTPDDANAAEEAVLWTAVALGSGLFYGDYREPVQQAIDRRIAQTAESGQLDDLIRAATLPQLLSRHVAPIDLVAQRVASMLADVVGDKASIWETVKGLAESWVGTFGELCAMLGALGDSSSE